MNEQNNILNIKYLELKKQNMQGGSNNRVLDIDHVMFPIYNNNKFLNEVASEYSKNKEYKYSIGP